MASRPNECLPFRDRMPRNLLPLPLPNQPLTHHFISSILLNLTPFQPPLSAIASPFLTPPPQRCAFSSGSLKAHPSAHPSQHLAPHICRIAHPSPAPYFRVNPSSSLPLPPWSTLSSSAITRTITLATLPRCSSGKILSLWSARACLRGTVC